MHTRMLCICLSGLDRAREVKAVAGVRHVIVLAFPERQSTIIGLGVAAWPTAHDKGAVPHALGNDTTGAEAAPVTTRRWHCWQAHLQSIHLQFQWLDV